MSAKFSIIPNARSVDNIKRLPGRWRLNIPGDRFMWRLLKARMSYINAEAEMAGRLLFHTLAYIELSRTHPCQLSHIARRMWVSDPMRIVNELSSEPGGWSLDDWRRLCEKPHTCDQDMPLY
jgi:hypothetical protein